MITPLVTLLALLADSPAKAPPPSGADAAPETLPALSDEDKAVVEHLELLERLEELELFEALDTGRDEKKADAGGEEDRRDDRTR